VPALDNLDLRLLDILQRNGALSVADIAGLRSTLLWR
jgi:DNA-binding Lrp family transcriptional regulator